MTPYSNPDPSTQAINSGGVLTLPTEFTESLKISDGDAVRLWLFPGGADEGCFYLAPAAQTPRSPRARLRALLRRSAEWTVRASRQDGEIILTLPRTMPRAIREGRSFHIVNYDPNYYFMSARNDTDPSDEASDRAGFWANIVHYHEHLRAEDQDAAASAVSRWFATEVLAPFNPQSVLEVGCGAGRNLLHIQRSLPGVRIAGIDVNPTAIKLARAQTAGADADLRIASLYDLPDDLGTFDVVYSMGVLMHVPHERVESVVRRMNELAGRVVIHLELHGKSHDYDFHRYPRDYSALYRRMGLGGDHVYEVFPRGDFRNAGESTGTLALLVGGHPSGAT